MTRLTRSLVLGGGLVAATAALALAHDMFLKPAQFFVKENAPIDLVLINGTFTKSENSIARNRLADISLLGPAGRSRVDTSQWKADGHDTSFIAVKGGAAGTYVLGVSTRSNIIPLTGQEFNEYLESDGIPDVLAARKRDNEMDRAVKERYHKHVKAMVQVGEARSDHYATALGYPAEVIPVENPYALKAGATFRFKAVVDGKPVANQYVQYGGRTAAGGRIEMKAVRTNADGIGEIRLSPAGTWYVKFINMTRLNGDREADYESKWASLTFAVR
jgi:uncharacterized GH25 family protein